MTMKEGVFKIWEGIRDDWPEDCAELGFSNSIVLEREKAKLSEAITRHKAGEPVHQVSIFHQYPLPIVVAMLAATTPVHVLDFGGGLGQSFLAIDATVRRCEDVRFTVLEFGALAEAGRQLFADESRIRFAGSLEEVEEPVDIIHAGSAFQYVDDWIGLLERFAAFAPSHIVFGNLLAGDIKPLVTYQKIFDHRIPVRFHNIGQVLGELAKFGYVPVFESYHELTILGERQPLPLDHFPPDRRLVYGRNVILKRTSPS